MGEWKRGKRASLWFRAVKEASFSVRALLGKSSRNTNFGWTLFAVFCPDKRQARVLHQRKGISDIRTTFNELLHGSNIDENLLLFTDYLDYVKYKLIIGIL